MSSSAIQRSILDLPDEVHQSWHGDAIAARRAEHRPEVLIAARDALLAAFAEPERRRHLDPFAPPGPRNAAVIEVLRAAISEHQRDGGVLALLDDAAATLLPMFADTIGWGPAQRYLDDPRTNEVKINGRIILIQESGCPFVVAPETFASGDEVRRRAVQLATMLGVRLDGSHPQETLPVAYGTRVHVTIAPRIADDDGALVCIRRGRDEAWQLEDLVRRGSLDGATAALLQLCCRAGCSVLIAGRTGSGKTGLLEALANSWPGSPHIISIEDHTLEIGIRNTGLWTRELVDTQHDAHAFGRAAREALRQTPGLLLPGETRGAEAGAILALALSGHPVITTLHARTAAEAIRRFAGYAAQPGAYMYEGRRDDSLADGCAAFDVVLVMDMIAATGRRVLVEGALLDGNYDSMGRPLPNITPLVTMIQRDDGTVGWHHAARAVDGQLVWDDGADHTPAGLRERLARMTAPAAARASLDRVDSAVERANQLLAAGDASRAYVLLRHLWSIRRDGVVRLLAGRALARLPMVEARCRSMATAARQRIEALVRQHRWSEARRLIDEVSMDVGLIVTIGGGWEALGAAVRHHVAVDERVDEALGRADGALARGDALEALATLDRHTSDATRLEPTTALRYLRLRETALDDLGRAGYGSTDAAAAVRARRLALEATAQPEVPDA
jgi:Flp pilus assembly CpaF family ATPase